MVALLCIVLLAAGLFSAVATAFVLCQMQRCGVQQAVRDDGPQTHLKKGITPTMGGLALIPSIAIVTLLAGHGIGILGPRLYLVIGVMLAYALVGLYDDLTKTGTGRPTGWRARYKIIAELVVTILFLIGLLSVRDSPDLAWHTSWLWLWLPLGLFTVVGGANAVNLTDGLDGLAAGLTALCGIAMAILLMIRGDLQMAIAAAAIDGAALGFLWLNAHPARILMGDVGSLGETLSVIVQVFYFKITGGKRVFRMAPFHHHLELLGWAEPTVVTRLWLLGIACALLGLLIGLVTGTGGSP